MRKIISILVAVGLVMGSLVAAAPASAQPLTDWTLLAVTITPGCEGVRAIYSFNFTPTADLHSGTHSITIKFPEGTGYPVMWLDGMITVEEFGGPVVPVFGSEVVRDGDEITFLLPLDIVGPDNMIRVMFVNWGPGLGIVNPPAGDYFYYLKTSRAPNSTYVQSGYDNPTMIYYPEEIYGTLPVYKWFMDFRAAYPGIAFDYVPPFKASGQNSTDQEFNTWYDATNEWWVTNFTAVFGAAQTGCDSCTFNLRAQLNSAPTGGEAYLYYPGGEKGLFMGTFAQRRQNLALGLTVGPEYGTDWESFLLGLHFNAVGTYEICFQALWTGAESCAECQNVERCITFDVKQDKDAIRIKLEPKWNLISLPIVPFDASIDSVLAPFSRKFTWKSVWHYDRCADDWFVFGNGQSSLTTIQDGKSYWVRMMTEYEFVTFFTPIVGAGTAASLWAGASYGPTGWYLWIFGTEAPRPPAAPSSYPQCPGWNMLGFRSVVDRDVHTGGPVPLPYLDGHLWATHIQAVYGFDALAQDWISLAQTDTMVVGQGYWVNWAVARTVNPPM